MRIIGQRSGLEIERKHLHDDRQKALNMLKKSEQRLELALMGADLGLWAWNMEARAVFFNERWAHMLG